MLYKLSLSKFARIVAPLFLVVVMGLGCAGQRNMVVLVADDTGHLGSATVSGAEGDVMLSTRNAAYVESDKSSPGRRATTLSEGDVHTIFSEVLSAEPGPPSIFYIYFGLDSVEADSDSVSTVGTIVQMARERRAQNLAVVITVDGYADRAGAADYNDNLALRRAKFVERMINARIVPEEKIAVISHGERNPLVPTADGIAEPRNRRVEVVIH